MQIEEFVLRLLLAVILGSLMGFERQWRQRSAGLRTNTLVCTGSAAYVLLSAALTTEIEANGTKDIEMEAAAGRLTIMRAVTHVSWEIKEHDTD